MSENTVFYNKRRLAALRHVLLAVESPGRATTELGIAKIATQFGANLVPPLQLHEAESVLDLIRFWISFYTSRV